MRLITLNCWGGRSMDALLGFFRNRRHEADVFCLQEVFDADQSALDAKYPAQRLRGDMYAKIAAELPEFQGAFARFEDDANRMSLAVFVRGSLTVASFEDYVVHVPPVPMDDGHVVLSSRRIQKAWIRRGEGSLLVANYHGLWVNGPKDDTPERLDQSRSLVEAMNRHDGPKVLCGDFNLLPATESVRILETEAGLRNLVVERGIASTRTPLYRHYGNPDEPNFADYVFASPDLAVKRFEVLPDVVSDHSPLFAEFA